MNLKETGRDNVDYIQPDQNINKDMFLSTRCLKVRFH